MSDPVSPFDTERTIDPATGQVRLAIRCNGEECLQGKLTSGAARSYAGFVSILKDLEDVLAFIQAMHALLPARPNSPARVGASIEYADIPAASRLAIKAHYFAAIALYGRCFVSATKGRGTTLTDAHIDPSLKTIHEHVMGFRHGLVAHAGGSFDEGDAVFAYLPVGPYYHVEANIRRLECEDDRQMVPNFESLVRHLIERVTVKQSALLDRLIGGEAKDRVIACQKAWADGTANSQ